MFQTLKQFSVKIQDTTSVSMSKVAAKWGAPIPTHPKMCTDVHKQMSATCTDEQTLRLLDFMASMKIVCHLPVKRIQLN